MRGENTMAILERLLDPASGTLSAKTAKEVLDLTFPESDQKRLEELADKSTAGTLTAEEGKEYDGYIEAADFLSLLQSKARLSLKQHTPAA
jgi:hypothetical protein